MTGVVTEVVYGNHHGMTIYPRKDSGLVNYVALYKPNVNTISQHCCIDNTADAEAACDFFLRYERAVMEYDAPLLKEGFMRIETFGTNGPARSVHELIIEPYLSKADAVLYLMDAARADDSDDRRFLTRLNEFGFRNLIIVCTSFDIM